ncbi:hypothetical protein ACLB1T_17750 [Escherichia coli]
MGTIRRPFDFPDSKEGQVRARLTFDGDHLATIVNMENNRQFGFFRLDPRLNHHDLLAKR